MACFSFKVLSSASQFTPNSVSFDSGSIYIPLAKPHAPFGEDSGFCGNGISVVADGVGGGQSPNSKVLSQFFVDITADVIANRHTNGLQIAIDQAAKYRLPPALVIFKFILKAYYLNAKSNGDAFITPYDLFSLNGDHAAASTLGFCMVDDHGVAQICTYGDSSYAIFDKEGHLKFVQYGLSTYSNQQEASNFLDKMPAQLCGNELHSLLTSYFTQFPFHEFSPKPPLESTDKKRIAYYDATLDQIVMTILDNSYQDFLRDGSSGDRKHISLSEFSRQIFSSVQLAPGDIVVGGSDCMWDCLPLPRIQRIISETVKHHPAHSSQAISQMVASNLAETTAATFAPGSHLEGEDTAPYFVEFKARFDYLRIEAPADFSMNHGKKDDNTVVVMRYLPTLSAPVSDPAVAEDPQFIQLKTVWPTLTLSPKKDPRSLTVCLHCIAESLINGVKDGDNFGNSLAQLRDALSSYSERVSSTRKRKAVKAENPLDKLIFESSSSELTLRRVYTTCLPYLSAEVAKVIGELHI